MSASTRLCPVMPSNLVELYDAIFTFMAVGQKSRYYLLNDLLSLNQRGGRYPDYYEYCAQRAVVVCMKRKPFKWLLSRRCGKEGGAPQGSLRACGEDQDPGNYS